MKIFAIIRLTFIGMGLISLAIIPVHWIENGPTLCLLKKITGLECYGCGMTRALCSLLHGDFYRALSFNKLVLLVYPILCFLIVKDVCTLSSRIGSVKANSSQKLG